MDSKKRPGHDGKKQTIAIDDNRGMQAVIVDYKIIACKTPGNEHRSKTFIQYTLEWLLIENFDEIFVCCLPDNADAIRGLVENFIRTENVPATMNIQVHSAENNTSTGDCLRDLDAKGLIRSDFVIMDVGCCGNLPLAELLKKHKALKKADKNAILTSITRNVFSKNPAEIGEFPVYVSDPNTGLLLHYKAGRVSESYSGHDGAPQVSHQFKSSISVPSEIFLERKSVKIHTNLCSTNLSIYSENVPALFTELFYCRSEAELIQAAFDNQEVFGGTVYISIVDDLFSQRMADFGFAINQKWDKFDTNMIYKRDARCQVLRKLVNDSLIDCTRLNPEASIRSLDSIDSESESESDSEPEGSILEDDEIFLSEVLDSLVRGYEESIKFENLILEVNSSKHAYNINIDDVYSNIAKALLVLPHKLTKLSPDSPNTYANLVETSISKFKPFLLNYIKNESSRSIILNTMEEVYFAKECEYLNETVLAKIFYKLYEIDVLDEDSLLNWYKDYDNKDQLRKDLRCKPAMVHVAKTLEAESEEDDESDGDE